MLRTRYLYLRKLSRKGKIRQACHHLLLPASLLLCLPGLSGCENSAAAFEIDTARHTISLIREKPYFWNSKVNQAIVVSRLPYCQRRFKIHDSDTTLRPMAIYEAGDQLWALHQDNLWYLASTKKCLVQPWNNTQNEPPGRFIGNITLQNGSPHFIPSAPQT